jgi:hypothetical protein
MKFKRLERYEPLTFSARKAAAFQKKQQRERDKFPLLAELIAEEQSDWESEKDKRQRQDRLYEQRIRDGDARRWRAARAEYFALPAEQRAACKAEWDAWRGPHNSSSLSYVVSKHNGWRDELRRRHREELLAWRMKFATEAKANQQLEFATQ